MQLIMQVLGPAPVCQCAGCWYETHTAIEILKAQGVEYLPRKVIPKRPHDPIVEAMGNAVVSTTCPQCGRTSYNLNDVQQRYCGHCHQFYDEMERPRGDDDHDQ